MKYDFDTIRNRRDSDNSKWNKFGPDVLPMWVADIDFICAQPILQLLHQQAEHGFFGYILPTEEFCQAIRLRLKNLYEWEVPHEDLFFLPGLVTGLNFAFLAFANPGECVLVQPPVYHHFVRDPVSHGRVFLDPPLVQNGDTYEIDFDAFEKAITGNTRIFILCNPHSPVARVFTKKELQKIAEICLRYRLVICSDEIHCDLLYPGHQHIPIATLSLEVGSRTITLMAPHAKVWVLHPKH